MFVLSSHKSSIMALIISALKTDCNSQYIYLIFERIYGVGGYGFTSNSTTNTRGMMFACEDP
jgi:hypothetical protein